MKSQQGVQATWVRVGLVSIDEGKALERAHDLIIAAVGKNPCSDKSVP